MEMEASTQEVAKKLWHIIRVAFFMLRKGIRISKRRIMLDLHLIVKRGNKLAGKAIGNLMYNPHCYSSSFSFSCRCNDALNFISPREYEFSCSNSPAFYPFNKHKRHHRHLNFAKSYKYDDLTTVAAVQKMLEMLNNEVVADASPMVLTGFGKSPMVRQLRITDSPYPLKDDGDPQVDKAAEEFIKKFYKNLKLQNTTTALESPHHGMYGGLY